MLPLEDRSRLDLLLESKPTEQPQLAALDHSLLSGDTANNSGPLAARLWRPVPWGLSSPLRCSVVRSHQGLEWGGAVQNPNIGICPHYNLYFNSLLYFLLWYELKAKTTKRSVNKQLLVPLSEFILKILGLSGIYFHGGICVHVSVSMHMCENWGEGRATEKRQNLETLEWEGDSIKLKNKCSLKPCWRVSPESRMNGILYYPRLTLNCLQFSDS